jgi:hypothetical protein
MASLQRGIRVVYAPHFHNARSWADRLQLNSGVLVEAGHFVCRDDWRQPSPEELALSTADSADHTGSIAVFNIPERLRTRWWDMAADQSTGPQATNAAFQGFATEVLAFLQFKMLPLPSACALDLVINAPGQASTHSQVGGFAGGQPAPGLLGSINLSDEESALVFLNLADTQLADRLPAIPASASLHEKARAFLGTCCDYPLTRLKLGPCEGFWLAGNQLVIDGETRGRNEVDVELVIRSG